MAGLRLQAFKAGEVGQWIRFGPWQLLSHQYMLKTSTQPHGIEHVHGIGPRRIRHHCHAQAYLLAMLKQSEQPGHGL
ncbi:hypothetical protein D3C85_1418670 [compost metagenome]